MAKRNISKARLIANAIGCFAIAAICLPLALGLAIDLGSMQPPRPRDPDGPKALAFVLFGVGACGLVGLAALVDFLRTVKALRGLRADGTTVR